ncbi:hypothetical protein ACQHIV_15860 [Kribbella sp. GL6]|uniref:hypothetical protein n=1 Tax=Kribbella sp. GL6 TaxID=3419765 RepID=UPI003CFE2A46
MTTKQQHAPLVPLSEFGYDRLGPAEVQALRDLYGVEVEFDYLGRAALPLDQAYEFGRQLRAAEAEARAAESRRLQEHAKAVAALQEAVNQAFAEAHDSFVREHRGQPQWGGGAELGGAAVNEGLRVAREVWQAASPAVADEVPSVAFTRGDSTDWISLSTRIDLSTIATYVQRAARKY